MVGKDGSGESLTAQYKALKEKVLNGADEGAASLEIERRLDDLYQRIIGSPIIDLGGAVEKLDFAHHCLIDEEDIKEAANLMQIVRRALLELSASTPDPMCRVILRKRTSQQICRSSHPSPAKPSAPPSLRPAAGGRGRRPSP